MSTNGMVGSSRANTLRASQFRQGTTGSFALNHTTGSEPERDAQTLHTDETSPWIEHHASLEKVICTLGLHDEAFAKDDVLVNPSLFAGQNVVVGTRMRIMALEMESPTMHPRRRSSGRPSQGSRTSSGSSVQHNYLFPIDFAQLDRKTDLRTVLLSCSPLVKWTLTLWPSTQTSRSASDMYGLMSS